MADSRSSSKRPESKRRCDANRAKTRINIGLALRRWTNLKEAKGLKLHMDVAFFLLDVWRDSSENHDPAVRISLGHPAVIKKETPDIVPHNVCVNMPRCAIPSDPADEISSGRPKKDIPDLAVRTQSPLKLVRATSSENRDPANEISSGRPKKDIPDLAPHDVCVNMTCLLHLFRQCGRCRGKCVVKTEGVPRHFIVIQHCQLCDQLATWTSQPAKKNEESGERCEVTEENQEFPASLTTVICDDSNTDTASSGDGGLWTDEDIDIIKPAKSVAVKGPVGLPREVSEGIQESAAASMGSSSLTDWGGIKKLECAEVEISLEEDGEQEEDEKDEEEETDAAEESASEQVDSEWEMDDDDNDESESETDKVKKRRMTWTEEDPPRRRCYRTRHGQTNQDDDKESEADTGVGMVSGSEITESGMVSETEHDLAQRYCYYNASELETIGMGKIKKGSADDKRKKMQGVNPTEQSESETEVGKVSELKTVEIVKRSIDYKKKKIEDVYLSTESETEESETEEMIEIMKYWPESRYRRYKKKKLKIKQKMAVPVLCPDCGRLYRTRTHTCDTDREFQCADCGSKLKTELSLSVHRNECRRHKCNFCRKIFHTHVEKLKHELSHAGDIPNKCPECPLSFPNKSMRRLHLKEQHPLTYTCQTCQKEFRTFSSCQRHELSHSVDKPFKCKVCNRAFAQACQLKSHERVHTGEKPFKCEFCSKCFNHNISLKTHVKRYHPGESPDNPALKEQEEEGDQEQGDQEQGD